MSVINLLHSRILLTADTSNGGPAWLDRDIAESVEVGLSTVERVFQRFVEQGLDAALVRKAPCRPSRSRTLDGRAEAKLIALACSAPPNGKGAWSMQMHADKLVELEVVPTTSDETSRRCFKKARSSRIGNSAGASRRRPTPSSWKRWKMYRTSTTDLSTNHVLWYVWTRPASSSSAKGPTPILPAPGGAEGVDCECVRHGTANQFTLTMPLIGWRVVLVTALRTAVDFAEVVRWLVEEVCAEAETVVLMMDNPNTHRIASLSKAFPPEQARWIAANLEIRHTLGHGRWLNMAEIKLSVLSGQCLDQRIDLANILRREVEEWEEDRNERKIGIDWQFTTADACVKLKRLDPSTQ